MNCRRACCCSWAMLDRGSLADAPDGSQGVRQTLASDIWGAAVDGLEHAGVFALRVEIGACCQPYAAVSCMTD